MWPLDCLDLLDKLGSPAWLSVVGSFSDPTRYSYNSWLPAEHHHHMIGRNTKSGAVICSPGGFQNTTQPVYQNRASNQSLGSFRSPEQITLRLNSQTVPEKQNRQDLCTQLLAVGLCPHALLRLCPRASPGGTKLTRT